jgi:aldehyde dehydrogenase (NAD+)
VDAGPDYSSLLATLRSSFASGRTRQLAWRDAQLASLRRMLVEQEPALIDALRRDLKESAFEAYLTDIGSVVSEIDLVRSHLPRWLKPQRVPTPWLVRPGTSRVIREPLGLALILGTWNYPIQLALSPLVPCLAAGNCAVLKPSEVAPHCSAALARFIPRYLDSECVAVVEGGVPETTALLEQRFDKIFYTGGSRVARIVMAAAARHLTPVTLELGGKSPCIVDRDANLEVAARRIVQGRFLNAGQTCLAPDYVLVHRDREEALLEALTGTIGGFYGKDPGDSEDFARIINEQHHDRLTGLIDSGTPVVGGDHDRSRLYIAPTVLRDVSPDSPVMKEEIFGPILPVLAVDGIEEAIDFVNRRDKPLALYVFSESRETAARVADRTSAGGMCVNETLFHFAVPGLPFGGVGESGMGKYHGKWGFDVFTNPKAVLERGTRLDPDLRYPPYGARDRKIMRLGVAGLKESIRSRFRR